MDVLDNDLEIISGDWDPEQKASINDVITEVNRFLKQVVFGHYLLYFLAIVTLAFTVFERPIVSENGLDLTGFLSVGLLPIVLYLVSAFLYPRSPKMFLILGLLPQLGILPILGKSLFDGYLWNVIVISSFLLAFYGVNYWEANLNALQQLGFPGRIVEKARRNLQPINRLL
jgi:hypothetical protein